MKIFGLTGGIASGKSTVTRFLRKKGLKVVCADSIAKSVTAPGRIAYKKIVGAFGPSILNRNRSINRHHLAQIVFSSPKKRKILNKIVHPEVLKLVQAEIKKLKKAGEKFIFLDVPLLYEEKLNYLCDSIVLVYAPEAILKKRLAKRNNLDTDKIKKRLASQFPIEAKKKMADIVIDNSGELERTKRQVDRLVKQIRLLQEKDSSRLGNRGRLAPGDARHFDGFLHKFGV